MKWPPFFRRFVAKISGEIIREKVPENPLIWEVSGKKCPNWSGKIDLTINGCYVSMSHWGERGEQ
jgi:hypothetical protein